MKQFFITLTIFTMTLFNDAAAQPENLSLLDIKSFEHQLDDVMEIIDTTVLKAKLIEVEAANTQTASEINKVRLGIIYHETALNLGFLSKTVFKGYAKKSYDLLTQLFNNNETSAALMPFIASYRASALALMSGETKKLKLVGKAFDLFSGAVAKYSAVSYLPEFLRGSVAENLPWIFYKKKRFAKRDMQSVIDKQVGNTSFASDKIMSFVYWAWANQHKGKKFKTIAIAYLDKAIALDKDYKGGRKRAEVLKAKFNH